MERDELVRHLLQEVQHSSAASRIKFHWQTALKVPPPQFLLRNTWTLQLTPAEPEDGNSRLVTLHCICTFSSKGKKAT